MWHFLFEPTSHFYARHNRHRKVEDYYIGIRLAGLINSLLTVRGLDNVYVRPPTQECANACTNNFVVIGNEDSQWRPSQDLGSLND